MRFFTKLTFICNVCFLIAVVLGIVENLNKQKGNFNGAIPLKSLEGTLVILGYGAIIVNIFYFIVSLFWIFSGKMKLLPQQIVFFNLILFLVQIFYWIL